MTICRRDANDKLNFCVFAAPSKPPIRDNHRKAFQKTQQRDQGAS